MPTSPQFSQNYGLPTDTAAELQRDRKIALLWGCFAALIIPVLIFLLKERALGANTPEQLIAAVRAREEAKIEFRQMIPTEGYLPTVDDTQRRWHILQDTMRHDGGSTEEVEGVTQAAQQWFGNCGTLAPVFARRGYIAGESVWVIEYAYQPTAHPICNFVTQAEIERMLKENRKHRTAVFSSQPPYRVLGTQEKLSTESGLSSDE